MKTMKEMDDVRDERRASLKADHPDGFVIDDVVSALWISRSSAQNLVKGMVKDGLVCGDPIPGDQRGTKKYSWVTEDADKKEFSIRRSWNVTGWHQNKNRIGMHYPLECEALDER